MITPNTSITTDKTPFSKSSKSHPKIPYSSSSPPILADCYLRSAHGVRILRLKPLPPDILLKLLSLHRSTLDNTTQQTILQLSHGSIGQALFLLENNGLNIFHTTLELLETLPHIPWTKVYPFIDYICYSSYKEQRLFLLQHIILWWITQQAYKQIPLPNTSPLPFHNIKYYALKQSNYHSWPHLWVIHARSLPT